MIESYLWKKRFIWLRCLLTSLSYQLRIHNSYSNSKLAIWDWAVGTESVHLQIPMLDLSLRRGVGLSCQPVVTQASVSRWNCSLASHVLTVHWPGLSGPGPCFSMCCCLLHRLLVQAFLYRNFISFRQVLQAPYAPVYLSFFSPWGFFLMIILIQNDLISVSLLFV